MKQLYQFLLCCCCLLAADATAQNWRPFRPNGDVHAFRSTASADTILTMRLDSAGTVGADSVYYFNRILRRAGNAAWQKARNNQFGQQLRYNIVQRTYSFYWNGGPSPLLVDRLLILKPFAPIGATWNSAFTDYGVATTLVSRGTSLVEGVMDSVVTLQTLTGATIVLSKNFGLVSAPANLLFGVPTFKTLTMARRPAPAGLSYYNPLTLLDVQPGDELGYELVPYSASPITCYSGYLLRKVLTRQVTADSLIYTLQQQSRYSSNGAPGCGPASSTLSPVTVVRLAASRRTGAWAGTGLLVPVGNLLTYAYRVTTPTGSRIVMSHPIIASRMGVPCSGPATLLYEALYQQPASPTYFPGIDALASRQRAAQAVGLVEDGDQQLVYTRRTVNGTVQTCGSRSNFATLLPTKGARSVTPLQLYPNPAADVATLTLPAPAAVGTTARFMDGVGRQVRQQIIRTGQTTTELALHGLAAGWYIVEVQAPGQAPQRVRIQHATE